MRIVRLHRASFFLGFLFLLTPAIANAATIDFEAALAKGWEPGETYVEDGYALLFESSATSGFFYQGPGSGCTPSCADNGTFNMLSWPGSWDQTMTLTRVGGGTFSLLAFDGAESFSTRSDLWAVAIRANGVDFLLDQVNDGTGPGSDFQTFAAALINVESVVFSGVPNSASGRQFKIDNLVVEATVPDHGETGLLLLLATGCLGLFLRRS